VDPIEKKPLYHFWPGSGSFSVATIGCNFTCRFCQNWSISQCSPDPQGSHAHFKHAQDGSDTFALVEVTPEEVVKAAVLGGCKSIAYTYNEPTIMFEFVRDTARLARAQGIANVLVTNGYSSPEANAEFVEFIDAANVDIKAFTDGFYQRNCAIPALQPVLDTVEYFFTHGVHVETTTLLIPGENDDLGEIRQMIQWLLDHTSDSVPVHFSAYHPDYQMTRPKTPNSTLHEAWLLGKEMGMKNVYMGNTAQSDAGNTYCPSCGALVLERHGFSIGVVNLQVGNTCNRCGAPVAIRGEVTPPRRGSHFF
jgi:pyruvate formate lyase activating enzyme